MNFRKRIRRVKEKYKIMKEFKGTKGEWISTFNSANKRGVRADSGFICFLTKPCRFQGQDERYEQELEEYKCNAKLIAAAPELLEALQLLLKSTYPHFKTIGEDNHPANLALKAINKAL